MILFIGFLLIAWVALSILGFTIHLIWLGIIGLTLLTITGVFGVLLRK